VCDAIGYVLFARGNTFEIFQCRKVMEEKCVKKFGKVYIKKTN